MSLATEAKHVLDVAASGLHGLEVVGELAKSLIPDSANPQRVLEVLHTITAIVDSVRAGWEGTASLEDVQDSLQVARDKISANDQAVDDAIDRKFPQ